MTKNALTLNSLMADEELFKKLLTIQPDSISINIGLSDIKQENLSWHPNQISKEYIKKYLGNIDYTVKTNLPKDTSKYHLVVLWNYRKIIKNVEDKNNIILFTR